MLITQKRKKGIVFLTKRFRKKNCSPLEVDDIRMADFVKVGTIHSFDGIKYELFTFLQIS